MTEQKITELKPNAMKRCLSGVSILLPFYPVYASYSHAGYGETLIFIFFGGILTIVTTVSIALVFALQRSKIKFVLWLPIIGVFGSIYIIDKSDSITYFFPLILIALNFISLIAAFVRIQAPESKGRST